MFKVICLVLLQLDLHDQNMVDYDDGKLPLPGRPVSATGISPEAHIPLLEPMASPTLTMTL